jgi:hypothetical protein
VLDANVTDAALKAVARMLQQLTAVELSDCSHVTDRGVRWLAQLRRLQLVDVGHSSGITDAAVAAALRKGLCAVMHHVSVPCQPDSGCVRVTGGECSAPITPYQVGVNFIQGFDTGGDQADRTRTIATALGVPTLSPLVGTKLV